MSYHQGMPFWANTTAVSSSSSGGRPVTRLLSPLAFSVLMTKSCGPSAAGSSDALTRAENPASPTRSVRPLAFVASRCGPRITQDTSCPDSASRTAKWLPTAPAPKTHIRMGEGVPVSGRGDLVSTRPACSATVYAGRSRPFVLPAFPAYATRPSPISSERIVHACQPGFVGPRRPRGCDGHVEPPGGQQRLRRWSHQRRALGDG